MGDVDGYSGTANDSLAFHSGMKFSTYDRDNDLQEGDVNCAEERRGAYWYNACQNSNLNGEYLEEPGEGGWNNIVWYGWLGSQQSLRGVRMMVRPALLTCPNLE